MDGDPRALVARLGLARHPEGGWFRETWRSPPRDGERSAATAILYLLEAADRSLFHRLTSEEAWFHHAGDPLTLHLLDSRGHRRVELSPGAPQLVVSPSTWFGATVDPPGRFALCGCVVVPGFEFADFELARRDDLLREYPDARSIIERLTCGDDGS